MKCNIYINSANSKGVVVLVWGVIIQNLARRETVYQGRFRWEGSTAKSHWESICHMQGKRGGSPGMEMLSQFIWLWLPRARYTETIDMFEGGFTYV